MMRVMDSRMFCVVGAVLAVGLLAGCLTPEEKRFRAADINADGRLTPEEATDAVMSGMFELYDANGDRRISRAEWEKWHADDALFEENDGNADGEVSLEEAQAHALREGIFRELFKQADENGDGLVTIGEAEEFYRQYHQAVR